MLHDPARLADTKAWLDRAATDLRAAALDLAADPPVLDDLVFHCQQAVEKAMKGLLSWHDEPFRKTHNLEELGEACLRFDPTLRALVDRAAPLTEYAWKFRYPGEHEGPSGMRLNAQSRLPAKRLKQSWHNCPRTCGRKRAIVLLAKNPRAIAGPIRRRPREPDFGGPWYPTVWRLVRVLWDSYRLRRD